MPALVCDITNGSVLFFNAQSSRPRTILLCACF